MSASVIRHVIVRGTVQGVGFRAFVQRHALERGLTGWSQRSTRRLRRSAKAHLRPRSKPFW
jgi:hydrogenase maturation factor HypF (carbamoyltransferase family)